MLSITKTITADANYYHYTLDLSAYAEQLTAAGIVFVQAQCGAVPTQSRSFRVNALNNVLVNFDSHIAGKSTVFKVYYLAPLD